MTIFYYSMTLGVVQFLLSNQINCSWPLPAQSSFVWSPVGLVTIFCCLTTLSHATDRLSLLLCPVYLTSGQTTKKTPPATLGCAIFHVIRVLSSRCLVLSRTCQIPWNTYAYYVAIIFMRHVWDQHTTSLEAQHSQFFLQHLNRSLFLELSTWWSSWLASGGHVVQKNTHI
jgi:hypothetical protein